MASHSRPPSENPLGTNSPPGPFGTLGAADGDWTSELEAEAASATARIRERLLALFPNDAGALLAFCYRENTRSYPLGFAHPKMLGEIIGAALSPAAHDDVCAAYVLLTAYYFLLDAVVDGHQKSSTDGAYLTHLLTGALFYFDRAAAGTSPTTQCAVRRCIQSRVSQNASAMRLEMALNAKPLEPSETEDRENIVGRSSSFLLLYDILCELHDRTADHNVVRLLEEFIVLIQWADDLSDWREDYRSSHWTSFLRTCFQRNGRLLSEADLEHQVYLGGLYEERSALIINRLQVLLEEIESTTTLQSFHFQTLVRSQRSRLLNALTTWVETKLEAGSFKAGLYARE